MKIFISWSKEYSGEVAKTLKEWLCKVLQKTDPFISSQDIDLGTVPLDQIASKLKTTEIGIIVVTKENLNSQWLNYESGAIATALDGDNKVIPLLVDLTVDDLGTSPLSKFQAAKSVEKDEMFRLLDSVNNNLDGEGLKESDLSEVFELWWPKLDNELGEIRKKYTLLKSNEASTGMKSKQSGNEEINSDDLILKLAKSTDRNTRMIQELASSMNDFTYLNRKRNYSLKKDISIFLEENIKSIEETLSELERMAYVVETSLRLDNEGAVIDLRHAIMRIQEREQITRKNLIKYVELEKERL